MPRSERDAGPIAVRPEGTSRLDWRGWLALAWAIWFGVLYARMVIDERAPGIFRAIGRPVQRTSTGSSLSLPKTRETMRNVSKGATPSRLDSDSLMWTASTWLSSKAESIATHRRLT